MRRWWSRRIRWAAARCPLCWRLVTAIPSVRTWLNRAYINIVASAFRARPHPLSLWGPQKQVPPDPAKPDDIPDPAHCADHGSWTGLADRTYTGRHLPPADPAYVKALPDVEALRPLFARNGAMLQCPKSSSALFGFFAQWFTDSFLRTDPLDMRKNTSNHEIDLCQIYGLKEEDTRLIRGTGKGGRLQSQLINGEEYPPYLFEGDGIHVRQEFAALSYVDGKKRDFLHDVLPKKPVNFDTPERKRTFFVTGLERGNSTILYSALNTVFLREHNRLCGELEKAHPEWDEHRRFETARSINIVQILKIIIEDYINHLSPAQFRLFLDPAFAEQQKWYRTNRICAEFNLLYRWHQLIPAELKVGGQAVPNEKFRFDNEFFIAPGATGRIESLLHAAATQPAGRIALKNTAWFLEDADLAAIRKSRAWRIKPYAAYREAFGLAPVRSFEQLTGDKALAAELEAHYKTVDRIEYPIGLLAERPGYNAMLGDLMTAMVGMDAFSQALTNPLLSQNLYNEEHLSKVGMDSIRSTSTLADIVRRTTKIGHGRASFALRERPPGRYGLPLIGWIPDTLDVFLFSGVEKFFRRRQKKLDSTVFKINLFQPTIAMLDHRAISSLFTSKDLVQEKPSNSFQFQIPPLPLVGDVPPSMFGDADAHDVPKRVYQRLLKERAATLTAVFQQTFREFTARWLDGQPFNFRDELEDFVVTYVFRWMLGANPPPAEVRYLYNNIFSHWSIAWTRHLPFSGFRRSLAIYQRLLEFVKTSPKFEEIAQLAAAEGLRDRDVLAKHLCFVLGMNSFLGNQSLLKSIVGELSLRPALREALRGEVDGLSMPLLDRTLREILRLHPPVFFIYGRATADRVIESASGEFAIAKGDLVLGVIPMAQRDAEILDKPEEFNPDRFLDPRASQHLIWARGLHDVPVNPESRTCPGKDVALWIAKLFCVELLRDYEWDLKEPPVWGERFTLNVAAPKGPLTVASFRRREGANDGQGDAEIRRVRARREAG
jgi:prostaglandin-endoperoxide synthase 2